MTSFPSEQTIFHGYAPRNPDADGFEPPFSVTISRQTGSRGRAVARRVAEMLGWSLLSHETLDYMTQHGSDYDGLEPPIGALAEKWISARLEELKQSGAIPESSDLLPLARRVLQLASRDPCVILGRGAGFILPTKTKLDVRLVAPERDRIAYISQIDRLSLSEAEQYVHDRERSRRQFLTSLGQNPDDVLQYDMVLNVAQLGIETCCATITAAVREKDASRQASSMP